MNGEHFRAFLWLRWRLRMNQLRRGGILNTILLVILGIGVGLLAIGLFVGSLLLGAFAFRDPASHAVMYTWDGIVAVFLFFWATALLADLQRSEPLSLSKVLHLPVSPTGAFLINYLSSLFSITLFLFLSVTLGFSIGLVLARGAWMLLLFPVLAAFFLMVTALTYQFQGWLASLMSNPRRRKTVIVVTTMLFILVFQLPNLLNFMRPRARQQATEARQRQQEEQADLVSAFKERKITQAEYTNQSEALTRKYNEEQSKADDQSKQRTHETVYLVNLVVPPGWLPLAADGLNDGNPLAALLGMFGFGLIGSASLWRAYRTTLRMYTGQFNAGSRAPVVEAPPTAVPVPLGKRGPLFMEKQVPLLSEEASAIALGGMLSLWRAPEAKMMLLTPVFLILGFVAMILTGSLNVPMVARPMMAFGGMSIFLLGVVQVAGNQFGLDRAGFRVYVLSPAPRREILLGKNFALAPLPAIWGAIVLLLLQVFTPLRIDHLLAAIPQMVSMFLLFCVLMNFLSILAPIHIAAGSFQPTNVKLIPVLIHLAFFFLFTSVMTVTLLPLGLELTMEKLEYLPGVPIHLIFSVVGCILAVFLYLLCLRFQGFLLHNREKHILTVVTSKD